MAIRSATADVQLKMATTIRNTLDDGSVASTVVGGQIIQQSFESGVGENQINRVWQKKDISIEDGGFRDFDLHEMANQDIGGGEALDALGQELDIEELALLVVVNREGPGILEIQTPAPTAGTIVWIPDGYAAETNGSGIREGGFRLWYEPGFSGLDIVRGSSNVIRLSAAETFGDIARAEIYILARSDDEASSSSSHSSSSVSSLSS